MPMQEQALIKPIAHVDVRFHIHIKDRGETSTIIHPTKKERP
jgi:hypothetical protein